MQAEPVLAVTDVTASVAYWHEVLGFPAQWKWGNPPVHGGVSWQGVGVQFALEPQLAAASKGNSVWMRVKHLDVLYAMHRKNKAEIVYPMENQPWGMAQYTVKDINGYYIHFASAIMEREKSGVTLPASMRIVARKPEIAEYRSLQHSVGWNSSLDDLKVQQALAAALYAVVAEDTESGEAIGCALLLGDGQTFYYVKDVIVRKDWQNKQVGTAIMRALTDWLDHNAAKNAMVGLYTGEGLERFYKQFGFGPAYGMIRHTPSPEREL
ncbi:GNAT family N-acetyltransferase [Chitinophaga barathri]|nr:GNAT family N-acetyltransferase [Chitinophaga barathri]